MDRFENIKRKFSNQRQWREFVSAVQCTVNYPAVIASSLPSLATGWALPRIDWMSHLAAR
jgi:hypothetical protein